MARDDVLAFRLARVGLGADAPASLADALACPAQDFVRDAVPLALLARTGELTQEAYRDAVDRGDVVVGHVVRGAIHGLAPEDWALWGRALLADDEDDLARQLGRQVTERAKATGIAATDQLEEVGEAVAAALAGGERLDRAALHAALRERIQEPLLPWCNGCESHHVAPMLWRFATLKAGARLARPNRELIAPDADVRKRLFRPVASPGAVLRDGRLVGLWRVKAKGKAIELTVAATGRTKQAELQEQADRIAAYRGATHAVVTTD